MVTDTMMRDDRNRPVPLLLLPKRLLVVRTERRGTTGAVSEATVVTVVTEVTEAGEPDSLSTWNACSIELTSSDLVGTTGEVAKLRTLE